MQITVVGGGKVGYLLARQLLAEGYDITVVDKSERVIEQISNTMDVMGYVGNGASYPVLQSVGVENSDLLIAVTETDEVNLLCCLAAHKLGAKHTVARVRNPEYADQLYALKDDLGLSMSINPERAAAEEIARILRFPAATRVELFARGNVELVTCRVPHGSVLDGLRLSLLPQTLGVTVLICAVDRAGDVIIPAGDFVLKAEDYLYLTGAPKQVEQAFRKAKLLLHPVRDVIITGGGRITYYLAQALYHQNINVKIIERDPARATELAERLPHVSVLQGDAADHELLLEEGLERSDAFVSLTGLDEGNILSALYALKHDVRKVIAKVNNESLVSLIAGSGVESVISPKQVTTNQILRYVRALAARSPDGNVLSLYKLAGGRIEVLEFRAGRDMEGLVNIPLRSLELKKNILIACLVRNRRAIIPTGSDCIQADDSVLVVTADQRINELMDILAEAKR